MNPHAPQYPKHPPPDSPEPVPANQGQLDWMNWPNRITIARIILVVPFIICLLNLNHAWPYWRYLAIAIFAVMAISDVLDGYLARRLAVETALGRFLDPVGDKLLVAGAVILLAFEATGVPGFWLPSWVAVVAIGKDVLTVLGFGLIYATTGHYFIQPRILGKMCTLLQCVAVGFCLLAPDLPGWARPAWPVLYWAASGLAVAATVDYLALGSRIASACHVNEEKNDEAPFCSD